MDKISVLLAEDHTIVRKGLGALLKAEIGIEVVGEAADGREEAARTGRLMPWKVASYADQTLEH